MVAARECAARKCSQAELARQCGVSTSQFNGYVKGKGMAAQTLRRVADVLGLPAAEVAELEVVMGRMPGSAMAALQRDPRLVQAVLLLTSNDVDILLPRLIARHEAAAKTPEDKGTG